MTIPANAIVSVTPSVLAAAGQGLSLNGVFLTLNEQVPIGVMQSFANQADVADYFGPNSQEALCAANYFLGFNNSNVKPGRLYFAQYNDDDVGAYLRGGDVRGYTLAQLQAITGSLTVVIDGATRTAASINLSGASSFSNAAALIQTALFATDPTEADATACTISGTTMTVGGTITGTVSPGQTVTGAGVTANSVILSQLSGTTGGAGTYELSQTSAVGAPAAFTFVATDGTVTFDSVSGGFVVRSGITGAPSTIGYATGTIAAPLNLQAAQGAVISQGAEATNPTAFMTELVGISQNWATFMTLFDPDNGSGNTLKKEFADWNSLQNNRWMYVCWDNDQTPINVVPASTSLGQLLASNDAAGTILIYDDKTDAKKAAFICGATASIDFQQLNGRITFAFKHQAGLEQTVLSATDAQHLIDNNYNFYSEYATANDEFIWFYPGQIMGEFRWADAYVNQIWMNNSFQLDLMLLLDQVKAVPYNAAGRQLIEAAVQATINAGLNFGAFSPGVNLSPLQIAEVNNAAGVDLQSTLFTQGYYFQVLQASPEARANRTTPPCTFWYSDAGAVQQINLASVMLQ